MRVGVITTSYPRYAGDHAGNFVAAHVAAMRALGHDVDVIAAGSVAADSARGSDLVGISKRHEGRDKARRSERRTKVSDRIDRIPSSLSDHIDRIPSSLFYRGGAPDALETGGSYLGAAAFTARMAAMVARRASRWDLIVAHWLAPSALAALPNRVPLLAIAHGGDVHTLARLHLLGPMLHALRMRRARLAFVSAELLELARSHGPVDGAIVQPMGVDVAHFAALGRAPTQPPTILVVARLVPVKGVDVAIDAMNHIERPARLVIAGAGPEYQRILDSAGHSAGQSDRFAPAIDMLGAHERRIRAPAIDVLGSVDTARRDQLLREASIVVVPSRVLPNGRTEGMPAIAIEALAAGVPVVASAVGGLRSLAAAALVPPDDPGALAASIDRVLAAPPSDRSLRASVIELDWLRVAQRLLAR
jgi:glycosyltransferase involved in cell wall biosynthesis